MAIQGSSISSCSAELPFGGSGGGGLGVDILCTQLGYTYNWDTRAPGVKTKRINHTVGS